MAGTKEGSKRAAITNKLRYGANFYEVIGRKGGAISRGGGFSKMTPEQRSEAGRKGGKAGRGYSRRQQHLDQTAQV